MWILTGRLSLSLSPEHLAIAVPVAVVAAVGGFLVSHYLSRRCCKKGQVNSCVDKDSPKVVHSFDMEDIGTKAVYCRCWKSKKVRLPIPGHTTSTRFAGCWDKRHWSFCVKEYSINDSNFPWRSAINSTSVCGSRILKHAACFSPTQRHISVELGLLWLACGDQ